MVGVNKNQSIHEVLPNLNHLDKHKPYGGLSIVFTGDLKQLGKVNFHMVLFLNYFNFIEPVKDAFIFKNSSRKGM